MNILIYSSIFLYFLAHLVLINAKKEGKKNFNVELVDNIG